MSELVIIGNGFDLHHGLNTSYGAFFDFAKERSPSVFELLSGLFLESHEYMGFEQPDAADEASFIFDRWSDFETCLGILDDEEFGQRSRDEISEYMKELGMEETLVNEFIANVSGILDVFRDWVSEVDLPASHRRSFQFDQTTAFVNFNYTETLEAYYGVNLARIFYIHGRRGITDRLIVGHDSDPPQAQHKDDLPDIQYNPFYAYLRQTRKPVGSIVPKLWNFLAGFPAIDRISVRGHSLGYVDHPYFRMVAKAYPSALWSFSYYGDDELSNIQNAISGLGVECDRISSVAKLPEFEISPNTSRNALFSQLIFQDLFAEKDVS